MHPKISLIAAMAMALVVGGGCVAPQPKTVPLVRANVMPLALSDAFEFRKTKLYFHSQERKVRTANEMIAFERRRIDYGVIDRLDKMQREGNYFVFFWKAHREAQITVRLEYRTANLGDYVQAREVAYPSGKGTYETHFEIIGDDFLDDGRVTAWRALLIENGRIVALNQSLLWN